MFIYIFRHLSDSPFFISINLFMKIEIYVISRKKRLKKQQEPEIALNDNQIPVMNKNKGATKTAYWASSVF